MKLIWVLLAIDLLLILWLTHQPLHHHHQEKTNVQDIY